MIPYLKSLARRILPERAVAVARVLLRRNPLSYRGGYRSFAAAKHDAVGYADPAIFEATRTAARAVRHGQAAFEHAGVAHFKPVYAWPTVACLQHAALRLQPTPQRPMHVIDFGGSLGAVYFRNRRFLDAIPLLWSIVEQPHYVACGNGEFADERLRFFDTISEAATRAPADTILFSSSLEYLESPYDVLTEAAAFKPGYIIFAETHLAEREDDEFKVQRVKAPYHRAILPMRVFSKQKLVAHLDAAGFALEAAFLRGFLFRRKAMTDEPT
jgi:putative methyltransferase (TIGR04325 family)